MARQKPARPFYEIFLERVIKIEAVQRYRAVVTEDHTPQFFEKGQRPGVFGDFLWALDRPGPFPTGPVAGVVFLWGPIPPTKEPAPPSLPMQQAWDAAVTAWKEFIAELVNGEMIAEGMSPISGIRAEMGSFEWSRTDLVLDVRNGDLIGGYHNRPIGKHTVRWSAITLRAAKQTRLQKGPAPTKVRWHGYDWDGAWAYALTLRAEDKWDWTQHRRDDKQPLPALHKTVEEMIEQWFADRGRIPALEDIRRNIVTPLYAGRRTRRRRKR